MRTSALRFCASRPSLTGTCGRTTAFSSPSLRRLALSKFNRAIQILRRLRLLHRRIPLRRRSQHHQPRLEHFFIPRRVQRALPFARALASRSKPRSQPTPPRASRPPRAMRLQSRPKIRARAALAPSGERSRERSRATRIGDRSARHAPSHRIRGDESPLRRTRVASSLRVDRARARRISIARTRPRTSAARARRAPGRPVAL